MRYVWLALLALALQGCNEISNERYKLQAKLREKLKVPKGSGRGVILVGGSNHHVANSTHSYTFDALLCIASLRRTGSTLPVELWHDDDPMLSNVKLENVILRRFKGFTTNSTRGYQLPALAMLHSSFEEFLYLDADNVVFRDPEALFEAKEYTTTGAVFWPDVKSHSPRGLMWQMLDVPFQPMQEVENGQLLIHRNQHLKALQLAGYFSERADFYFRVTLGDKDLLLMAFLALHLPFHQVATPVGSLGYLSPSGAFCGHTAMQYHPADATPLFLHRNLLKWSANLAEGPSWKALKPGRLTVHAPGTEPAVKQSPDCRCNGAHYEDENFCVDLDTELDNQSSNLLKEMASLEMALLRLRSEMQSEANRLKEKWQSSWSSFAPAAAPAAAAVPSASWVASYLVRCVERIPLEDLEFEVLDSGGSENWAEHPHTNSGKHLRCLAEHPLLTRVAVLFYGYPGPNGAFAAGLGLRAKAQGTPLWTAEADARRCAVGQDYLKKQGMDKYVDLHCSLLCEGMQDEECQGQIRRLICPERLDLLAIDFALGVPPVIYRGVMKACHPRVLFTENSGLFLGDLPGQDDESHSNFSEHSENSWHHWEEQLFTLAAQGHATELGDFRLSVARKASGFDAERLSWWDQLRGKELADPRRFSVYVSKDAAIGEVEVPRAERQEEL